MVQTVSEWVQHFATGDSHDTSGHSGKYQEYTSPNTVRRIGSVQYDFDPLNDSGGGGTGKTYQVFILELSGRNVDAVLGSSEVYSGNSQQHRFHFTDGVVINPNVRIGIGLHRTDGGNNEGLSVRAGAESQDSPRESYDDASEDFNFVGRFNHDRPTPSVNDTVGGTTSGQIYGNPEIFYQIIHTHASLVGDGNVSANHISSGNAADGTVLTADGSGGVAWEAVPSVGVELTNALPDALTVGQATAVGVGNKAARSDHSHGVTSGGPPQDVDTEDNASAGTATTFARGDHVHAVPEDFITPDMLKADSEIEQGLMRTRIDAQEDLSLVTQAAAEAGTETTERVWSALRVAQAITALAADTFDLHDDVPTREVNIGSSDRFVFSDEAVSGDPMRYATFVDIRNRFFDLGNEDSTPNDDDLILICDSSTTGCPQERIKAADLRTWIRAGLPSLSDSIPVNMVPDQTSAPGSGTTASRHDHVHGIAAATPSSLGTSNSEGTATTFARSDHVHGLHGSLIINVPSIPDTVTAKLQTNDQIILADDSDGDADRRLSWSATVNSLAGVGMDAEVGANSTIDLTPNFDKADVDAATPASGDMFAFTDVSETPKLLRKITRDNLRTSMQSGVILGVTTASNSGLSGGVNVGTATLVLDIHNTGSLTGSLADDDRIAIANESAGNDATQHMEIDDFRTAMQQNIPAGNITTGTLAVARVPDLDAAKIATGTIDAARLPRRDSGNGDSRRGGRVEPIFH